MLNATDPFVASEMEHLASPMSCEAEEYLRSLRASAACIHRCSARSTALSAAVTRRTTFVKQAPYRWRERAPTRDATGGKDMNKNV